MSDYIVVPVGDYYCVARKQGGRLWYLYYADYSKGENRLAKLSRAAAEHYAARCTNTGKDNYKRYGEWVEQGTVYQGGAGTARVGMRQ